jgi:hypothetical protein
VLYSQVGMLFTGQRDGSAVGSHCELGGGEGAGMKLFHPQFRHSVLWEGLAVIVSWEGERGLGYTVCTSVSPDFPTVRVRNG